eukprot:scaffold3666_cov160-Amphora_coffeaeformis.AAC.18
MEGMGRVQSFGSRCVRPPIIWTRICRPKSMTVREFKFAQDLTSKPVNGMLTGPVTILNWSFPRVDISRKEQAFQLGTCIRQEIKDLEKTGCCVIQVDEPALREGMPIDEDKKEAYLEWTVDSFRLATAGAKSVTQIHMHMCYCEFKDCMNAIDRMDTDESSIENSRNGNETLEAFVGIDYQKGFGLGVYDIHSPVVPKIADMEEVKIKSFLTCLEPSKIVVNPDCGTWAETSGALKNMVDAADAVRAEIVKRSPGQSKKVGFPKSYRNANQSNTVLRVVLSSQWRSVDLLPPLWDLDHPVLIEILIRLTLTLHVWFTRTVAHNRKRFHPRIAKTSKKCLKTIQICLSPPGVIPIANSWGYS